jgi:ribosomal-protein-alanine N-acetyltransferase
VIFTTERLQARPYVLEDVEDAFTIYSDPEVMRYLLGSQPVESLDAQREWLASRIARFAAMPAGFGAWALVEIDSGRVIGTVLCRHAPDTNEQPSADVEIGWHLARRVWGRGYATEAGKAILRYGLETMKQERIIALVEPPNARSNAVCERLGMTSTGHTTAYYGGQELRLWQTSRACA